MIVPLRIDNLKAIGTVSGNIFPGLFQRGRGIVAMAYGYRVGATSVMNRDISSLT